jgi:hypothetical protein
MAHANQSVSQRNITVRQMMPDPKGPDGGIGNFCRKGASLLQGGLQNRIEPAEVLMNPIVNSSGSSFGPVVTPLLANDVVPDFADHARQSQGQGGINPWRRKPRAIL